MVFTHLPSNVLLALVPFAPDLNIAIALLLVHLSNSYIYFGKHAFWNFVNTEAQMLLSPLKPLPLRVGTGLLRKLAPLVGASYEVNDATVRMSLSFTVPAAVPSLVQTS